MRIFALETDIEKIKKSFISLDEKEKLTMHYHWMKFIGQFFWCGLLTAIIAAVVVSLALYVDFPLWADILVAFLLWALFVFPRLLRAYIDWKYDFVMVTSDKVVLVDQSSIFRQKITPINLENVSGVSTETQFLNLFNFGILHLDLNESAGAEHTLRFISHAHDVASVITEALTSFQRRKDLRRYAHGEPPRDET